MHPLCSPGSSPSSTSHRLDLSVPRSPGCPARSLTSLRFRPPSRFFCLFFLSFLAARFSLLPSLLPVARSLFHDPRSLTCGEKRRPTRQNHTFYDYPLTNNPNPRVPRTRFSGSVESSQPMPGFCLRDAAPRSWILQGCWILGISLAFGNHSIRILFDTSSFEHSSMKLSFF